MPGGTVPPDRPPRRPGPERLAEADARPCRAGEDKAALERVAKDVEKSPAADPRVPLFLLFAERCRKAGIDPSPMLKRIHRTQPNDFWLNLRLGQDAADGRRYEEAVQFYHSAVVLRPDAAIAHNNLAMVPRRMKRPGRRGDRVPARRRAGSTRTRTQSG